MESHTSQVRTQERTQLKVVVLSCSDLGIEVARTLNALPAVQSVALVTAPYRAKPLKWRIRHVYRTQGPWRMTVLVARNLLRRVWRRAQRDALVDGTSTLPASIRSFHCAAFDDPACLRTLAELEPDLGIVAGTYILTENVFSVPRLGSINLHSGKAPEYRGAAPAFWELYNGETEVGITIHRVTSALDAGTILLQEVFPLDPAPEQDPLAYVEEYRREVLRPNGVRMLAEAVTRIAEGSVQERVQDPARARTYRTPDYRTVRDLRRRVRERRRQKRGRGEA